MGRPKREINAMSMGARWFWGVVVTVFFSAVIQWTPVFGNVRPYALFVAWIGLLFACAGWAFCTIPRLNNFRLSQKGNSIMMWIAVFLVGGGMAVLVWRLVGPQSVAETTMSTRPATPRSNDGGAKATGEGSIAIGPGAKIGGDVNVNIVNVNPTNQPETKDPWIVDVNPGQTGFVTVMGGHLSGRVGFVIDDLAVANKSQQSTTLKEVMLLYKRHGIEGEVLSGAIPVSSLNSNLESVILLYTTNSYLFCRGWTDIRSVISRMEVKPSGGVWRGSAAFIFKDAIKSADEISDLRLRVKDYLNREEIVPLKYDSKNDVLRQDGVQLRYGKFHLENGMVKFDN